MVDPGAGPLAVSAAGRQDGDQYLALMNGEYRRKKSEAYYRWFFLDSPFPSQLFLAHDEAGAPIGTLGVQVRPLTDGRHVGLVVDMLVVPAWRGRGVFRRLEQAAAEFAAERGCAALAVFPNPAGQRAIERVGSWSLVATISTMSRPRPGAAAKARATSPGETLGFRWEGEVEEWRFGRHPEHAYVRGEHGCRLWYKVFETPDRTRSADLVLLEPCGPDPALSETLAEIARREAAVLSAWALPHTALYGVLARLGFGPGPPFRAFSVRVLREDAADLRLGHRWHVCLADTEVY